MTKYTIKALGGEYLREQHRSATEATLHETLLSAARYLGHDDVHVDADTDPEIVSVYTRAAWNGLEPGTAADARGGPVLIARSEVRR